MDDETFYPALIWLHSDQQQVSLSAYVCTSGISSVPRFELDMVVNTIHTIMEEHQQNDGSKV